MKKIALFFSVLLFMGTLAVNAQTRVITGKVTSAEDEAPIPGVSIVVSGTTLGTVTDINGNYSVQVPADAQNLIFSFVGMASQEVAISGRSVINISMQPQAIGVDEVIVVAYGTTTKESFTGSAGTVDSEELGKRQVSNVTQSLSGKIAGVQTTSSSGQPGTAATVRIRGIGSMSASNDPLYVIDGVPYSGSLSAINPNDIETLTTLKDAAASAIYGARGANGVIIITTKSGKTKEALVKVDARWGTNKRGVPNYEVMTDPAMYYETFYQSLYNNRIYAGASSAAAHQFARNNLIPKGNGGLGYMIYTIPEGEYFIGTNGKINPNATLGYSDGDYFYTPDNWYDELFDKGNVRQEYNVSVSGATDKISYYISAGYLDDSGIVEGSGFSRFTGRLNADYQAKDWLKVGANIDHIHYDMKSPTAQTTWGSSGNLFYAANMIAPIYPMYVRRPNGDIWVDDLGITVYDFGTSTNQERAFMGLSNPAITMKLDKHSNLVDQVNSRWFADIDLMEGLKFSTIFGAGVSNAREVHMGNPFYGASVSAEGDVSVDHSRDFSINQQYLLTYKKSVGDHNFDILVGHESFSQKWQYIETYNKKMYNPYIAEIGNAIFDPPTVDSRTAKYATLGYLSRIRYDFNEKYFLSASYRRDASSRFHPDNRWGNFGSIGGAWVIDKESFFESLNAPWVNLLKLKASYGMQGNDALGNNYPYLDQFTVFNSDGNFSTSFSYKGNPDVTWETSYSFNTGLEFELFRNGVSGGIEYFSRKTVDLLYNQPVPVSWGYATIPTNVGSIRNNGVELDLNISIIRNRNLNWSVDLNATHLKNEILDLEESVKENGIKRAFYIYTIGGSLYNSFLREWAGVDPNTGKSLYYRVNDQGEYILDEETGEKTTTDVWTATQQKDQGSTLAKVYGGFGTSLDFFGFDVSAALAYQLGGKVLDFTYEELMHSGDNAGLNWHKDILDAWTPTNTNTNVPRLNSADDTYQLHSTRYLTSSDYLSLNNVTVGYTLPKELTENMAFKSIRFYFVGDNLALLTARKGLDPRQMLGGVETTGNWRYTNLKTFSGGITLTF